MVRAFASLILLASFLPAQKTWIVDAAGGTGVDFTAIAPAVAPLAGGVVGSNGRVELTRPIAKLPALLGAALGYQALSGSASTGLQLSNGAPAVLCAR